jgi:hypothetical protein
MSEYGDRHNRHTRCPVATETGQAIRRGPEKTGGFGGSIDLTNTFVSSSTTMDIFV